MSSKNATTGNLPRLSAAELSEILLAQSTSNLDLSPVDGIAVVDVRDDDHIGGHIKTSLHIPSQTHAHAIPTLVHKLRSKPIVVFHCALSQVRGPKAALAYVRERERLVGPDTTDLAVSTVGSMMAKDRKEELQRSEGTATLRQAGHEEEEEGEGWEDVDREGEVVKEEPKQRVFVLQGGFVEWQQKFGEDVRLTEGYRKELWKDGYWM